VVDYDLHERPRGLQLEIDDDMDGTIDEDCACAQELPTFSEHQRAADLRTITASLPFRVDAAARQDLSDGVSYDMIVNAVASSELSSMDAIEPYTWTTATDPQGRGHAGDVGGSGVRMPQGGPYPRRHDGRLIKGWILAGCPTTDRSHTANEPRSLDSGRCGVSRWRIRYF
jgi:hypothetical protein